MTSSLRQLEQQFGVSTAETTNKLLQLSQASEPDRSFLVDQIERHLQEAHELLDQIDHEIHSIAPAERSVHLTHLDGFRKEYDKLRKEFLKSKTWLNDEQARIQLNLDGDTDDHRTSLLNDTQRLEATGRKLEAGYKMSIESQQVGVEILDNLNTQRETIRRNRDRLRTTNYELGRGSRLANLMIRRSLQTKAILYGIGAFVTFAMLYVVFDSVFH